MRPSELPKLLAPLVAIPIGAVGGVVTLWLTALAIARVVGYIPAELLVPWWVMDQTIIALNRGWMVLPGFLAILTLVVFLALWVKESWSAKVRWISWVLIAVIVMMNFNIAPAEGEVAIIDLVAPVVIAWSIIGANWLIVRNIAKWETRKVKSQATVI